MNLMPNSLTPHPLLHSVNIIGRRRDYTVNSGRGFGGYHQRDQMDCNNSTGGAYHRNYHEPHQW